MLRRFAQFSSLISSTYKCIQKIETIEMSKYGLKGSHAQYLEVLSHYPDGITSAKLCEICSKDKAGVSRIVNEMEEKGIIKRTCENDNNYRAILILTEKGKECAEFVCAKVKSAVEMAGSGLSDAQRKIFYDTLSHIENNLQIISEDGIS